MDIMDTKAVLSMNKSQYLSQILSASGLPCNKLVVGAIIFHPSASDPPRLLSLKRSAQEKFYPNVFEVPGGHVEDGDTSIYHGLIREVNEETALSVVDVNGTINSFSYTTEKLMKPDDGEKIVTKLSLQLNYVCTVDDASFTTNPQEHSEGVWATREYIAGFEMTEKMKVVVENAFAWYEKVED